MTVVKSYAELGRWPMVDDRVLISRDAVNHRHWTDRMSRFIGTIMTVRYVDGNGTIKMKEDIGEYYGNSRPGWDWFLPMIDGVVLDCAEDVDEDAAVWTSDFSIDDLLTT